MTAMVLASRASFSHMHASSDKSDHQAFSAQHMAGALPCFEKGCTVVFDLEALGCQRRRAPRCLGAEAGGVAMCRCAAAPWAGHQMDCPGAAHPRHRGAAEQPSAAENPIPKPHPRFHQRRPGMHPHSAGRVLHILLRMGRTLPCPSHLQPFLLLLI
jgi:hypothetical protein